MVFYQVVSTYQLICTIVHKIVKNPDKKAVLLISQTIPITYPNYRYLERYFDRIIIYNNVLRLNGNEYSEENDVYFKQLFEENDINLNDFEEIHANACHHQFSVYLTMNNIPFIFWEDASGVLSRPDILRNIDGVFPLKVEFIDKIGLYDGTAPCIQKIICNFKSQVEGFQCDKAEDFDVVKSFYGLPEDVQKEIKLFYVEKDKLEIPKDAVLFLTQHLANLRVLSLEEQCLIYQLVIDYFFENQNIVFKPHPNDILYYGLLFPQSKIIREKFPSEFLPTMFTNKPKYIATISSTAINPVRDYFDKIFELNPEFETKFRYIHKYAIASKLKNKYFSENKLHTIGANDQLLSYLVQDGSGKSKFYIIDDLSMQEEFKKNDILNLLQEASDKDVFVFINSKNDYCFYDIFNKNLWENIIPINIHKTQLSEEEFYADTQTETIYVFAKNKKAKEYISSFETSFELKFTKLKISVESVSDELKNINVLTGLIAGTESTLLKFEKGENVDFIAGDEDIKKTKFSNSKTSLENLSKNQQRMRILEGILDINETRLLNYLNKQKGENKLWK